MADEVSEQLRQLGDQAIDALRQCLQDQVIAVPIDDQRWQQIRLRVDQTIRGGVDLEGFPESNRLRQPCAPEAGIHRFGIARDKP